MGIPAYFSHIIKNHKNIIKKIETLDKVDNLYMDCNSIIYDSFHSLENKVTNVPENIIKNVILKIKHYITTINPKKNIILAFDGVAPVAKLEQQRTRRTRSQFLNEIKILGIFLILVAVIFSQLAPLYDKRRYGRN